MTASRRVPGDRVPTHVIRDAINRYTRSGPVGLAILSELTGVNEDMLRRIMGRANCPSNVTVNTADRILTAFGDQDVLARLYAEAVAA